MNQIPQISAIIVIVMVIVIVIIIIITITITITVINHLQTPHFSQLTQPGHVARLRIGLSLCNFQPFSATYAFFVHV